MTDAGRWRLADVPDQAGRTAVVTGASSGLGLASARELATRGAHVVMAVRDLAKGRRVRAHLLDRHADASLQVRHLDLAEPGSVPAFADGLRRDGITVDVLINNAGILFPPRRAGPYGYDLAFTINHLGPFALTGLLLPMLDKSGDPRVVTVTSTVHRWVRLPPDRPVEVDRHSPFELYARSKLANVLFGLELHRRLRAVGSPVRSLLAHPGYAATNVPTNGAGAVMRVLGRLGNILIAQDATKGALPQLYAATDPAARCGQFIGPDGLFQSRGHPTVVRPAATACDRAAARRLWELSERLTRVEFNLPATT
jgi:NAD(P)-dependent dehydrogenase (short-subunit alcohol dehydrogenase family)